MRGEVGRYGRGGDKRKHRKRLGTHWKSHHGRADKGTGTGAGKWKDGNESAGDRRAEGPGQRTDGQVSMGGGIVYTIKKSVQMNMGVHLCTGGKKSAPYFLKNDAPLY